ncbi:acyl-CoA thioester hydrolase/BAAT C-terminal domain-containing protein [Paucibacter sp. AS339]|uniref:acyl-CoA thioester hydrolase/BAAT C-terminal domain-containing protein n=1 Tax=Paucibacter hankyongi TaxID=3133434 RepID=UPI0030A2F2DF
MSFTAQGARLSAIGLASSFGLLLALPAQAQSIRVLPATEVLAGTALHLSVEQLKPGSTLRLQASRVLPTFMGPKHFESNARFIVGASGRVDLDTQAPLAGSSYQEADGRGLFWAMRPAATPAATREGSDPAADAERVRLQAFAAQADGQEVLLGEQTLYLRKVAANVQTKPVDAFPGARFAVPSGGGKRAALIVLGGSEGGSYAAKAMAPELASQGYAVLGLPYYSPAGWSSSGPTPAELPALPASFKNIELELLEKARDWLAQQPEVDAQRIGVYGISKGAEFALNAAARMPWIKAVVAVVPTDVVWEGWGPDVKGLDSASSFSWKGQALPWVPYKGFQDEFANAAMGKPIIIRRPQDAGRTAHPERVPAARIPIENYKGPLLMVGGSDDQVWDSGGMARNVEATRARHGLPTISLVYEGAGHAITGHGYNPTTQSNAGPMKMGGTPAADAHAQGDAYPKLLEFLRSSLR